MSKSERQPSKGSLRKLASLRKQPWVAPAIINETALSSIRAEPRTPLYNVIDLMAFGGGNRPRASLEIAAKRQQAATALFDAAKRSYVHMIGNPGPQGNKSEPIPAAYFDDPHCLGCEDNTIETDISDSTVGMKKFVAIREDRKNKCFPVWSHVRVETKSFLVWLQSQSTGHKTSDERACRDWLASEMTTSPTRKTQTKGHFKSVAKTLFPTLSGRGFDRAWTNAVKDTGAVAWENAGAPRKIIESPHQ